MMPETRSAAAPAVTEHSTSAVIVTLVASTLLGHLRLPLAVVGHEGSTVLVVLNGLPDPASGLSGVQGE